MHTTFDINNPRGIDRKNNNQMLVITSPSALAGGYDSKLTLEMSQKISSPMKNPNVRNLRSNQLRPKFPKNPKLKPLKTQSAFIDVEKNRKKMKNKQKKNIVEREESIPEEPMTSLFANHNINKYGESSANSSKISKSKPRYSISGVENKSLNDSSFD